MEHVQYVHYCSGNVLTFPDYTFFIMVLVVLNGILATYVKFIKHDLALHCRSNNDLYLLYLPFQRSLIYAIGHARDYAVMCKQKQIFQPHRV